MVRISAILAFVAALSLAAVKFLLAESLWWPFAIVEYLAAAMLLIGAVLAWRSENTTLLTAGWGFAAGITWSTLFHHLQSNGAAGFVEFGLGVLLTMAAIGIGLVSATRRQNHAATQVQRCGVGRAHGCISRFRLRAGRARASRDKRAERALGDTRVWLDCRISPLRAWRRDHVRTHFVALGRERFGRTTARGFAQSRSRSTDTLFDRRRDYSRLARDFAGGLDRRRPLQS